LGLSGISRLGLYETGVLKKVVMAIYYTENKSCQVIKGDIDYQLLIELKHFYYSFIYNRVVSTKDK